MNFRIEAQRLHDNLGFNTRQVAVVTAVTLSEVAFRAKKSIEKAIAGVFDRPTPWIRNSVYAIPSRARGITIDPAQVGIKGLRTSASVGTSGVAARMVSPAHALYSEVEGGIRRKKAWESSLSDEAPNGRPMLRPGARASLDSYGNLATGQIRQIMSAFQASHREGFAANSRIRGVSGLTRSQVERVERARLHDEFLRSRNMEANEGRQAVLAIQARQRLRDWRNRLGGNESLFSQARSRVQTWMVAPGKAKHVRGVIYLFRWTYRWSRKLGRNVYKKTDLKPVAVFTRNQSYRPRLDVFGITRKVFERNVALIWEETSQRLFRRWGNR